MEKIRPDHPVFLADGEVAIGAVRAVHRDNLDIYIENAGDFVVPVSAVFDVHFSKVILDGGKLDKKIHAAIDRAHAVEDDKDHLPD
jgi:hypothetical protein